jgi:hypothetical protein
MQTRSNSPKEQSYNLKPTTSAALYFVILIWMFAVLVVYFVLFGPSEFWLLAERIGINDKLVELRTWLQPLLTANYLSP